MDRVAALDEINRILKPNGVLGLYRYMFPVICSKANEVMVRHCKLYWNQFRDERLIREDDSDIIMKNSQYFSSIKTLMVPNIWKLTIDEFVQFLCSTSYVSKYLESIEELRHDYIHDFTQEILNLNNDNNLEVNFDIHMFIAKK